MKLRTAVSALVTAMLLLGIVAGPASAAALKNDSISSPIVIGTVPYTNSQDTRRARTGATDPPFCYDPEGSADSNTVWYSFTPTASGRYAASTFDSDYDTTLYVGTANADGGIDVINCVDDSGGTVQSYVSFEATAGTTYLIMVGTCCGTPGSDGGGSLVFSLDVAAPALVLDVTVDSTGSVDHGVVTLTGTASCSQTPDFAEIDLSLRQDVGKRTIEGFGFTEISACGPSPTPWMIVLEGSNGRFAGGQASADISLFACSLECQNVNETFAVRLH
jgi:hypothetical protein